MGGHDLSEDAINVLKALAKRDSPSGSKDIAEVTGLDKKVVSKEIADLKKIGFVNNPVRCKYGITSEGKTSLS